MIMKIFKIKKLSFTFIILFCCVLLTAKDMPDWKKKYQPDGDDWKKTEQHFIFNNGAEPKSLDPAIITSLLAFRIVDALFEGLISLDPKTLEKRPGMATHWEISKDGITYTFYLRKEAKWSNGRPLNADDFINSWERVLNPKSESSYKNQMYPIKNAEEYSKGTVKNFKEVGISKKDNLILVITLKRPCKYFLDLVAFQTLCPVPLFLIKEKGIRWYRPENIVSNGPYILKERIPREKIVLVKNPHYWDKDFSKLEKITILPYDKTETAYKVFKKGKIHWMPQVPLSKQKEIFRKAEYYRAQGLSTFFYRFNCTKLPFNNVKVRQAFCMAIDRKVITEILKGGQIPATWFCPPTGGYQPVKGLPYNKANARKLLKKVLSEDESLKKAGYDKKFPTIDLLYSQNDNSKKVAEALVEMWKNNLGIDIKIRATEWKVYLDEMDKINYTLCRGSWYGDYNDPNTFFDMWVKDGGLNRTGWFSKEYDELLIKSQKEMDSVKREGDLEPGTKT